MAASPMSERASMPKGPEPDGLGPDGLGGLTLARLWRPLVEWLIWMGLGLAVYAQTGAFEREIPEYLYGPDGWPKVLCIALMIGASGQLFYQLSLIARGQAAPADDLDEATRKPLSALRVFQRVAIFCFPLLYLYLAPSLGFYIVTPFFLLGMLLILEVKSPLTLITVTAVVYGLFLLVFTRFFYVAVPVGQFEPFYSLNNAIIVFARSGL